MGVLSGLNPKPVFEYFEQLCAIPHGSYNTKAISDFIVDFAKVRGLYVRQDAANNVVIKKPATVGFENASTIMLQGHIDMVCEKDIECPKDMDIEGLDLFVAGDVIGAYGTTLGADDGIAAAIMMAVLDSDDFSHPAIECVFTTDEEVGMGGADRLDVSDLCAKYLINIDAEVENVLIAGCAGSSFIECSFGSEKCDFEGTTIKLVINGLLGGHSGEEIHLGRANSNKLMGRLLQEVLSVTDARLVSVKGGNKDNAIPTSSTAYITVVDVDLAIATIQKNFDSLKQGFASVDANISLVLSAENMSSPAFDKPTTEHIIAFLNDVPNGVVCMSKDVEGLVQTSTNLGRVFEIENGICFSMMPRSSSKSDMDALVSRIKTICETNGGIFKLLSMSSAWEYKKESKLREVLSDIIYERTGNRPGVEIIHAGLECGIFLEKMPWLDCVSIGPNIDDIHTPRERMHIESTSRIWDLVIEALTRLE